MRQHPINPHIKSGPRSELLIYLSRRRLPFLSRAYMLLLGCDIGIGLPKDTFLPHPQGIIIHSSSIIGSGVTIGHQVTIGGRDFEGGAPRIGDGVYIGAGAKILGPVSVGAGATIGANAVITRDVPPAAIAVGANRILDKPSPYALPSP